ncbi:ephrin type-A receptor 2-like [Scleropages formosus]|uniref:Ephrin type-A receptor 2-like n=1 Tax=Scleropages formosus TaxID=113540 RepID=A0A0P7VCE2_SCLFO|nr:ephrin type-A receptor 2-like [Scleropages formosus]
MACQPGFFKTSVSSELCGPCPKNTQRSAPGALSCPCQEGFYRAPEDPQTAGCSGPPSAPRDLYATSIAVGKLRLSWRPPADTGGRDDISYSVSCERCEAALCQPCGGDLRFDPGSSGLQELRVNVLGLEPGLNYTFRVEALSGVSQFSSSHAATLLTTTMLHTDPPKVTLIHLDKQTATSLTLSWAVSQRSMLRTPRYELKYRKKVSSHCEVFPCADGRPFRWLNEDLLVLQEDNGVTDITTYTVLLLEKNTVQISDLVPGTAYVFRVTVLSPEGTPNGEGKEHEFETLPQVEAQVQSRAPVVLGAALGGGTVLLVVVVVLLLHKRRRGAHTRQGPEDTYFSSAEQLKPLKTYVDPHTYEDPNVAVLKFAAEIHPSHITKQKVIGAVKHAMIVTDGCDGSPFRSIAEWLESIKMSQYNENFTRAGIVTMEQVLQMKTEDVRNIGVRLPGHLKRIAYSILGLKDQTSTLSVFAV